MKVISFAKYCARVLIALKEFYKHKEIYTSGTYFPENQCNIKNRVEVTCDQLFHIFKYSYCNKFYFLYGFDVKNLRNQNDYVDYTVFMRQRNLMNTGRGYSHVSVLRDKALFDIVASKFGFCTPQVYGLVTEECNFIDYSISKKSDRFSTFLEKNNVDAYLKVIDGECADGVFHIVTCNGKVAYSGNLYTVKQFIDMLPQKTRFILQEKMPNQHSAISALHPKAVNTIRLVTVIDPETNKPIVFSAVLRVGVKDNDVDNWAAGGLSIGIDTEKQELRKYGFYKPGFGTKTTEYPDSHIVFEGYKVPYLKEAIEEAVRFHRMLPTIHSIGWDIAITETGPCFIEGNDNWEISLMQISNHGLQKEFKKYFYK